MILVGDPMQLQPVMSEAEQQIVAASNGGAQQGRRGQRQPMMGVPAPGANNVIGKSLFAWIQERRFAPASTVLLDQQNRMHPAIGELVSRVFYAGRVRTGPAAPRRGTGLTAFPSPVTWVDTRSLRGNVESRAGGTSLFNVAEARLVTSMTRHLASHAPPNLTIGVITAYAEQRDLLRRLMGPHDWPPERQLEIDTVDAFEGREKDIIVLSLVRANRRRDIGFLRLEQRLNVAVSRSRRLIIIVGDTSTLRQGYFNHLVTTAHQVGQITPAPKLIGMFLSRGRRRHERDDRRRDGVPEEAGVGEMAALPAGSDEEAQELAATETTGEAGVAPAMAPGREGHVPTGSRRRRRRAWERRRERLRALRGQGPEEPVEEDSSGAGVGGAEQADLAPFPRGGEGEPEVRERRPRRRRPQRGDEDASAAAVEAPVEIAAPPPAPEPEATPTRRRRRRAVAEPETTAPTPLEVAAEVPQVPAESTPARRTRTRRAAEAPVEIVAPPPAPEPEATPARRRRAPRTAPVVPNGVSGDVPSTPAPLKRSRSRRATDTSTADI
jgi:hypothetical protein